LAACSEKPQELAGSKVKGSAPAWQGAKDEFVQPGWKVGDRASWEQQMKERAKGQNEYARIGGAS
jgi:hypothetical protein